MLEILWLLTCWVSFGVTVCSIIAVALAFNESVRDIIIYYMEKELNDD